MSKVRLTTITPVHIGSGNVLYNNIDFVQGNVDGYPYLGVVDHQKLMKIIGPERVDSWVAAIERGSGFAEFVGKCSSKELTIEDYSSRLVYCPQVLRMAENEPMREYIHDGMGKAFIPGSSLKGAIRTAVLSHLVVAKDLDVNQKLNFEKKTKTPAKSVEEELFGKDPNSDSFRFLQIGDVYFNNDNEYVYNMININERERQSYVDKSKHQLVEAIFDEDESRAFNMKMSMTPELSKMIDEYNQRVYDWNHNPINAGKRPKNSIKKLAVSGMTDLFSIINEHTKLLLEQEIDDWGDVIEEDGVRDYLNAIRNVIKETSKCTPGECVLRVGHASGWRFTTGAWTEALNDDKWDALKNIARPGNQQRYYGMRFPKSRRVNYQRGEELTLLGFVKLSIVE